MVASEGPRANAVDTVWGGGHRDQRSIRKHEQTRGELALWSEARAGSPKIRLRCGERDSGCFSKCGG